MGGGRGTAPPDAAPTAGGLQRRASHVHGDVSTATIPVHGLSRQLRVVHITDSHVDLGLALAVSDLL